MFANIFISDNRLTKVLLLKFFKTLYKYIIDIFYLENIFRIHKKMVMIGKSGSAKFIILSNAEWLIILKPVL